MIDFCFKSLQLTVTLLIIIVNFITTIKKEEAVMENDQLVAALEIKDYFKILIRQVKEVITIGPVLWLHMKKQ